ncbi:hypothetical protein H4W81_004947 [Nonomuraea africana]|uniref:Uncharacterized protein n=1 Tax=Nonomuraea africana TaxID=46171 RepID=A0ABR9KKN1_9ACTN|nr:hypothetical protein [Nonomuraea africana]MBE1562168.1 hypothetical protein [Nonomuraea africana]
MRQGAVAQLVQSVRPAGQASGGGLEEFGGAPVGQPGLTGSRVEVAGRQFDAGAAAGEEERPGAAAVQQSGQEPGGGGAPDDDVDGAALAPYPGAAVAQVEVTGVEGQDLLGAGGALVQQPEQGALAQGQARQGEQRLDVGTG